MKLLTVGFVFDATLEQVLLVHKQKPDWQVGKLNGPGGKVEDGETPLQCVARECLEETCLDIPTDDWRHFATILNNGVFDGHKAQIEFYTATYPGQLSDACRGDYEEVEWFNISDLPDNCLQNLYFMIPLAREALRGHTATITIEY